MLQSPMNALHNASNPYQGKEKKVLCVCSAGLLRSPTIACVLQSKYGYNTRACGVYDYALIPISTALVAWADEVVFAEKEHYNAVKDCNVMEQKKYRILEIPDRFWRMDEELQSFIIDNY